MVAANVAAIAVNIAGPKQCFKEGTLVETEAGLKPIEEIEVGDEVLAYDKATGEQAYKAVKQLFRNETLKWCTVTVAVAGIVESIISTPGHKYYLPENRVNREIGEKQEHASYIVLSEKWVSACNLKSGDKVLLSDGEYGIIQSVKVEELSSPETTYNLEVEDFHTYYVGENSVCVHNKNCNVNQMNEQIRKGQAPKGVKRIDLPKVKGEQVHAHLDKGSAINIDGTLKHGNGNEITVGIAKWLKKNGWKL